MKRNLQEPGGTEPTIKCRRCCRPLRAAASRAAGIGARCAAIETALAGLDGKQQDKALELIADHGITPTHHHGIYAVTSTSGDRTYLTSAQGHCTCPWGLRRISANTKTCYHVAAVQLTHTPRRALRRSDFGKAA